MLKAHVDNLENAVRCSNSVSILHPSQNNVLSMFQITLKRNSATIEHHR